MLFDILIISLIGFLALAVLSKDLLPSAIALALASVTASIIFYMMGAMWVAVFELTIVAGLITVLFISAISLTRDLKEDMESDKPIFYFPAIFIVVVILSVLGVYWLTDQMPNKEFADVAGHDDFRNVFWGERKLDILGLTAVILAGVFGIAAFFRKNVEPVAGTDSPLDRVLTKQAEEQKEEE